MGLLSDGGVHSHERHLVGLLELAAQARRCPRAHPRIPRRPRHAADVGPRIPARLEAALAGSGGKIATVSGRYYAMDRDKRWDRVARAYHALVFSSGLQAESAQAALEAAYARGETDEFVQPTVLQENGEPVGPIRDGDAVVFFNFRADRARQLTRALTEAAFSDFPRPAAPAAELRGLHRVQEGIRSARGLSAPGSLAHPRRRLGRGRHREPAPRRDREVRARDVLLQRRRRDGVSRARSACSCRPGRARPTISTRR